MDPSTSKTKMNLVIWLSVWSGIAKSAGEEEVLAVLMEIHNEEGVNPEHDDVFAVIGTQTGLIKEVSLLTGAGTIKYGTPQKNADVISLAVGRSKGELVVGKKNGLALVLRNYRPVFTVKSLPVLNAVLLVENEIVCVTVEGERGVSAFFLSFSQSVFFFSS